MKRTTFLIYCENLFKKFSFPSQKYLNDANKNQIKLRYSIRKSKNLPLTLNVGEEFPCSKNKTRTNPIKIHFIFHSQS